jgi:hypothetical protein
MSLVGQRFGRLRVLRRDPKRRYYYLARCDCGNSKSIRGDSFASGKSRSCGCLWKEAISTFDGMTTHPLFFTWRLMHSRCYNKAAHDYKHYGGRGIKVCIRWRLTVQGFRNYIQDIEALGRKPAGYSLDRIDNDGWYKPGNMRWATAKQQSLNQRQRRAA